MGRIGCAEDSRTWCDLYIRGGDECGDDFLLRAHIMERKLEGGDS